MQVTATSRTNSTNLSEAGEWEGDGDWVGEWWGEEGAGECLGECWLSGQQDAAAEVARWFSKSFVVVSSCSLILVAQQTHWQLTQGLEGGGCLMQGWGWGAQRAVLHVIDRPCLALVWAV